MNNLKGRQQLNVLVTGIGSPGARGVIRSLHKVSDLSFRIVGVDINPDALGAVWADTFSVIQRPDDPGFGQAITELCHREGIDVILPLVTQELPVLAQMAPTLANAGTFVALSSRDSLLVANHKGQLLEWLKQTGVPVPDFVVVNRVEELRQAIETLGTSQRSVCFKPVHGDGSRGFRIVKEPTDAVKALFEKKPDSTYISRAELFEVLKETDKIPELVVMEYLPGEEYSVDVLARDGETLVAVPRLRQQMTGGITTRGVIVNHPDVTDYVAQVVSSLRLHGNIGVQVRRNQDGLVRIVEVNPRLQGTTVHTSAAGVNMPWLCVKLALGEDIHPDELKVRFGTRMIRHWDEVFFDESGQTFSW